MINNRRMIVATLLCLASLCISASASALTIVTSNLYAGNQRAERATQRLLRSDPDVLVVLEYTGYNLAQDRLAEYRAVARFAAPNAHGIAVYVRSGIEAVGTVIASPVSGPCAMPIATVRLNSSTAPITLIALHAPPPLRACNNMTGPTVTAVQQWLSEGRLQHDIGVGVRGDMTIVAGDLNSFPRSSWIRDFARLGFEDAGDGAGTMYSGTWSPYAAIPKVIRIDYVFVPTQLEVTEARTFRVPGSDHKGILLSVAALPVSASATE